MIFDLVTTGIYLNIRNTRIYCKTSIAFLEATLNQLRRAEDQAGEKGGTGAGRCLMEQVEVLYRIPPCQPGHNLLGLAQCSEEDAVLTHIGNQGRGGSRIET